MLWLKRATAQLLISLLAVPAVVSAGQINNGSFEAGNFGGWKLFAYGAALTPTGSPWPPITGSYSALVVAMSSAPLNADFTCADDVWNVACPEPLFRYTGDGTRLTYEFCCSTTEPSLPFLPRAGAAIGQDVIVNVGDRLQWDWRCVDQAGECSGSTLPSTISGDIGWFFARNLTEGYTLATGQRQLQSGSFIFPAGGLWSVYFGVAQGFDDNFLWSGLQVDNVVLRDVAEPGSMTLALAGLGGLLLVGRKAGRKPCPSSK